MKRTGPGFTIVELLIVVVVIAILAAITIVSYNGIAERARNTELLAKIDAYTKALKLYKTQNGSYPVIIQAESGNTVGVCLGSASDYPASSPYSAGNCAKSYANSYNVSATLMSQLSSITTGLPLAATSPIVSADGQVLVRGILFVSIPPSLAYIQYIVKGDQDCARGVKSYNSTQYPGMTQCVVMLD